MEVIVVTERERLIQLIDQKQQYGVVIKENQMDDRYNRHIEIKNSELADYLLKNGVSVTACASCDYIKHTREKGMLIELMGKPIKIVPNVEKNWSE